MNLPRFGVRNPIAVNLLMWGLLISGAFHWFTMVREFFPPLEAEQISITIAYPGATPEDVERAVALRIEREIRDIDDIEEIQTSVYEGVAVLLITIEDGADRDRVLNSVRSEIDKVKPELPEVTEDPEIIEVRPYVPVITVMVSGDVPEQRLREAAIRVRDDLLDREGLSEIVMVGDRKREIWVEVRPERLEEHGLTFGEMGRVLAESNLDLPAGQIKSDTGNIRVRTVGESRRALEIEQLVIKTNRDGSLIRLRDIADVTDRFEDKVLKGTFGTKPAIQLVIFKTPEQDALNIAKATKEYVAEHSGMLGGAIALDTTTDLSLLIEGRLDLMVRNARVGLILVLICLALFLSLRTAFWVAVGLVVALVGTFTAMWMLGASINLLSLFGLIIVLGLVVDDAVVIGESMHRKLQDGLPPEEAAEVGANEMAAPVLAAVLTSVFCFAPLYFMEGVWGKFLGVLPVVVISALVVSLIEAFLILPAHIAHSKLFVTTNAGRFSRWLANVRDEWFDRRFHRVFERFIRLALRWRYVTLSAAIATLVAMLGLLEGGVVPFVLLQDVDAESVTVRLEMAAGTPESETQAVVERIERDCESFPEVNTVFAVVGTQFSDRGQQTPADPATVAQLFIELHPADRREVEGLRSSTTFIEEMRARTANIAGVDKLTFRAEAGSPQGADIEIRVRSPELRQASEAADHVIDVLAQFAGVHQIEKDLREGKMEAHISLLPSARATGLTTRGLASQVQSALFGFEAQELQEADDEVKVRVVLPEAARRELSDLERLRIATDGGGRTPLFEIADVDTRRGYATLHRVDGKRAVTVRAEVAEETGANVKKITTTLEKEHLADIGERFPGVSVSFEGRNKETMDAVGSLYRGFPFAMLGVYALIAILFRSYFQPFLVMLVIPFSLIGAVTGHLVMGFPFTLLSTIGCVALSGIVVNDSLILVNRVNECRRSGASAFDAAVTGARQPAAGDRPHQRHHRRRPRPSHGGDQLPGAVPHPDGGVDRVRSVIRHRPDARRAAGDVPDRRRPRARGPVGAAAPRPPRPRRASD